MTGARLELANPNSYKTVAEYVEQHVAPVVTELHRLVNEVVCPGSTSAEEWETDMCPHPSQPRNEFGRLSKRLYQSEKHVFFDGTLHEKISKDILRAKQLKVQLSATIYQYHPSDQAQLVCFRLTDDDGNSILNSILLTDSIEPEAHSAILPFGDGVGCIKPTATRYYIEASTPDPLHIPVCRRLALSFVYI